MEGPRMVDRRLGGPARVNCQLIERSEGLQKRSRAGLAMVNATRLREDERGRRGNPPVHTTFSQS